MADDRNRFSLEDFTNVSPASRPCVPSPPNVAPKSSKVPAIIGISVILLLIAAGFGCYIALNDRSDNPLIPTSLRHPFYKKSITEVLQRDEELSSQVMGLNGFEEADDKDLYLDRAGNSILNYVREARSFDKSAVPKDFAAAYLKFLSACEKRGRLLIEHPHIGNFFSQFLEGFFHGLSGNFSEIFARDANFQAWAECVDETQPEIISCWEQVKNSAKKYGVVVDQDEPQ